MVLTWDSQWQPVEVAPGVYHLKLPIPDNPLGYLNSYLLKDNGSYTLVDCGWPSRLALEALQEQLARLNLKLSDIASVVVTHFHADHLGLARVIREEYGMEIMLNEVEAPYAELDRPLLRPKIKEWLVSNGVPVVEIGTDRAAGEGVSPGPHPEKAEPAGANGEEAADTAGAGSLQDARRLGGAGLGPSQGSTELQAVYETRAAGCRERVVSHGDDP